MFPFEIKYSFTYKELKPLLDFLERETVPTEKHFPGMNDILNKLMAIKKENEHVYRS